MLKILALTLALEGTCSSAAPPGKASPHASVSELDCPTCPDQKKRPAAAARPAPAAAKLPPKDAGNLLDVVRRGLRLHATGSNPRIQAEIGWFVQHPTYFDKTMERARPYLYHIVSEVRRQGLPMEIALLPMIESGFDPFALSWVSASGLWQFMPATARQLGLEQNWWYDGRRSVVESTSAALTYLQALHRRFQNWELALAAYNSGQGTIINASRRNTRAGKPVDFWSLPLPQETADYVPKLLALSKIFKNPDAYGIVLRPVPNKPFFKRVRIARQMNLAQAACMAGMEVDRLLLLNPGFNRWATAPDNPKGLLIPVPHVKTFTKALAAPMKGKCAGWHKYKVQPGDSLSLIAHRFGTSVKSIQHINGIRDSKIMAGRTLLVPNAIDHGQHPYVSTRRQTAGATKKEMYTVRPGDSMWKVAHIHNLTVRTLFLWNKDAPRHLKAGQKLAIWKHAGRRPLRYRVRPGDNLSSIAKRYALLVADIRAWNDLKKERSLYAGEVLTLFVPV
ncbi:MAG: LysM peptidoglycan-binding domain-containing protein [Kistimonas sp.]|nr:LysM peptidoglycan-binding domain-containing protein [Kistimonas sp.]